MLLRPIVRTKGGEVKKAKSEKKIDRVWQKNVIHREQGGENRQKDSLDERSQVEDERRHVCVVSSSAEQTQDLGKLRGKPIDGHLDGWGRRWSSIALEPLLPSQTPMGSLCT
jgi:hypothetical protein